MTTGQALREETSQPALGQRRSVWPRAVVAATVAWNLWQVRATVAPAAYPDDNSVHEQMVRFATSRIQAGHDPLTSWFPFLGLGSPQFLHYQSTPAILTGLAGLAVGPDTAFRWSLYLLWCLWPVAIYASARVLGLRPQAAACAAAVAPLLHSAPGIGYEQHAYLWAGYGVWTQLWGAWALPFAWAFTWRAMASRRFLAPAAAAVALTAAFHYETGYLAFLPIVIMPFLVLRDLRGRLVRAAVLLVTALLASAWVVVPLLAFRPWTALNQALAGTPMADGYGARQVLDWLVAGRVFDDGHLPVISLLAAAGLAGALLRWRHPRPPGPALGSATDSAADPAQEPDPGRALVALLCAALVLSFGRTTFGGLTAVIPGSADLFFRRFMMGAQLAGIYLAGLGAMEAAAAATRLAAAAGRFFDLDPAHRDWDRSPWPRWAVAAALGMAAVAYLYPAWHYDGDFAAANAADVGFQQLAQQDEPQAAAAAAVVRRLGGGRVYAGSPAGWGQYFMVGFVPMYAYLESQDVDEVGYPLRTASLMSQPEYHFDVANPGDYPLFGVRYLVLPALKDSRPVPRGAVPVLRDSLLRVYELPGDSYIRVADTVGSITETRADIGSQTTAYLRSALPGQDRYLTVAYAGARAAPPTLPAGAHPTAPSWPDRYPTAPSWPDRYPTAGPGTVLAQQADLAGGSASATVHLRRRAVVVLSASYDPGWSATIDGRPAATEMVAPALVAVTVPPGTHRIAFRYTGFRGYPWLLALAAAALIAVYAFNKKGPTDA